MIDENEEVYDPYRNMSRRPGVPLSPGVLPIRLGIALVLVGVILGALDVRRVFVLDLLPRYWVLSDFSLWLGIVLILTGTFLFAIHRQTAALEAKLDKLIEAMVEQPKR